MTYSILYHEGEGGREWLFHHISHESQITCKLQSLTFKLCHVDSSGTTLALPPYPPSSTRRPLLMPHFIMQHDGESRSKTGLLSLKQLPSPADKEKPKSEWSAEWAERLQKPHGQLQLVSLTWRRAPGQRPTLGAVHPQPSLAKRSSISGDLPALSSWLS